MKKTKLLIALLITVLSVLTLAACGSSSSHPYDSGYTVEITLNANGGMMDSREIRYYFAQPNSLILEPGNKQASAAALAAPTRTGYVLTGWYRGTADEDGNVTLKEKWNFESDRVSESMTLYAGWDHSPAFVVNVPNATGGYDQTAYYVSEGSTIYQSNLARPKRDGYTFVRFVDERGEPIDFPLTHNGGNERNEILIYTEWLEGEYILITTAAEFRPSGSNNYYIMSDLDFTGRRWTVPANFTGTIEGNGKTISGIDLSVTARRGDSGYYGLFGRMNAGASVSNLTVEANVTVEMGDATSTGICVGMLAGVMNEQAKFENVVLRGSVTLKLDNAIFGSLSDDEKTNILNKHTVNAIAGSGALTPTGITAESVVVSKKFDDIM